MQRSAEDGRIHEALPPVPSYPETLRRSSHSHWCACIVWKLISPFAFLGSFISHRWISSCRASKWTRLTGPKAFQAQALLQSSALVNTSVFPGLCDRKDQRFLFNGEEPVLPVNLKTCWETLMKAWGLEHWVSHFLLGEGNGYVGAWVFTGKQPILGRTRDSRVDWMKV